MANIKKIFITYFYGIWFLVLLFDIVGIETKVIDTEIFMAVFIIFIVGYAMYGFWMKKKMYG